jgi:predicted nucleotidyltransferase
MDTEEIVARLKEFAQARSDIIAVYLYGSYANGTARSTSDIDVAVLFSPSVPDALKAELELDTMLSSLPGLAKVEVAALNRVSLRLRAEVLQTGLRVYCRDEEARAAFEFDTMRQWWDMQTWHETYNREFFDAVKESFTDDQRRSYQDVFGELADAGRLPHDLAAKLADLTGLRNLLVHRYLTVEPVRLPQHLRDDLKYFEQFAAAAIGWADELEQPPSSSGQTTE